MDVLSSLVDQVPAAADLEPLFAGVDEAPTAAADAAEADAWVAATAAHLQLLARLVQRVDAAQLGLEVLAALGPEQGSGGGAPPGPPGSVRIEELGADAPSTALPTGLVLAAALYGSDAALARPWAASAVAAAAQELLAALAARLPPAADEGQQGSSGGVGLLQEASSARSASSAQQQQRQQGLQQQREQPPEVQRLLALALPGALQQLRPVAAAKVEHGRRKTARLEPYTGAPLCRSGWLAAAGAGLLGWQLQPRLVGGAQQRLPRPEEPPSRCPPLP